MLLILEISIPVCPGAPQHSWKKLCSVYLPSLQLSSEPWNVAAPPYSDIKGSLPKTFLCVTLCKSNKSAHLAVDLCRGRRYEVCRIVPRTCDGTVVFSKCAEDGE